MSTQPSQDRAMQALMRWEQRLPQVSGSPDPGVTRLVVGGFITGCVIVGAALAGIVAEIVTRLWSKGKSS